MSETLYEISLLNSELQQTIIGFNHSEHNVFKREAGTPRSCSDPLSFASFLAFALAVSNLMMNAGGGRRKRRSVMCEERSGEARDRVSETMSIILTGVIASQRVSDQKCQQYFFCKIGNHLSTFDKVGDIMSEATQLLGKDIYTNIKVT